MSDSAELAPGADDLEPSAGEGDGHTHEAACLNCGEPLTGPHCRMCGQRGHVHRTLGAFFHDLLHGILHFEGKIWRTLPLLVWKPGTLTRQYIDGRRASYVSPIALFLFVVFLTFAGFNALGQDIDMGETVTLDGREVSIAEAESTLSGRIAELQRRRAEALERGQPVTQIDEDLRFQRWALGTVDAVKRDDVGEFAAQMSASRASAADESGFSFDALWRKAASNPDLLIYQLRSNAYKYSWMLIPISVPFMWLLFPFSRRFRLYDHTVFVTYSLSFMMLVLLLASIGAAYDFLPLVMIPVLYAPIHMYRQLSAAYGTGRLATLARTGALLLFAAIALTLWALALVGLVLG